MPEIKGISHVALTVRDQDISEQWYTSLFGLVKANESENPEQGVKNRLLRDDDAGVVLLLVEHDEGSTDRSNERLPGLDHLSFAVDDRATLKLWAERLDDLGIDHAAVKETPAGAALEFRDPDNIQVELFVRGPISA